MPRVRTGTDQNWKYGPKPLGQKGYPWLIYVLSHRSHMEVINIYSLRLVAVLRTIVFLLYRPCTADLVGCNRS